MAWIFRPPRPKFGNSPPSPELRVRGAPPTPPPPILIPYAFQTCQQFVSFYESHAEEGRRQANLRWRQASAAIARKRLGGGESSSNRGEDAPPKKRRRIKAFLALMQINNVMKSVWSRTYASLVPRLDGEGRFLDCPFTWPHANFVQDRGRSKA